MDTVESLRLFGPELVLAVGVLLVIAADLLQGRQGGAGPGRLAFAVVVVALLATLRLPGVTGSAGLLGAVPQTWLFGRMIVLDAFSAFFKLLLGLSLLAGVWMSLRSPEVRGRPNEGEYFAVMLASGLGMFLMASAANLLMAYLALELVSLTAYVLTGHLRHDRRSGEAAMKYLIYGGVASGAMIYGMSWLFGLTGVMDYPGIAARLAELDPASRGALFVALVLILAGFGYKISAVPFHMWAPDVYQGAPLPVTTFLAVGSKAAVAPSSKAFARLPADVSTTQELPGFESRTDCRTRRPIGPRAKAIANPIARPRRNRSNDTRGLRTCRRPGGRRAPSPRSATTTPECPRRPRARRARSRPRSSTARWRTRGTPCRTRRRSYRTGRSSSVRTCRTGCRRRARRRPPRWHWR